MEDANTKALLARMIEAVGAKTDTALAQAIGVSPQSISDARRKSKVPPAWAISIADKYQVSLDWLMFGQELTPKTGKETLLEAKIKWLEAKITLLESEAEAPRNNETPAAPMSVPGPTACPKCMELMEKVIEAQAKVIQTQEEKDDLMKDIIDLEAENAELRTLVSLSGHKGDDMAQAEAV